MQAEGHCLGSGGSGMHGVVTILVLLRVPALNAALGAWPARSRR